MRIAMVSEHASPLACLGGVDAGGQNVHVASLAAALAGRGHRVEVYTRADDPTLPGRVPVGPGVEVVHVTAGPLRPVPKDDLLPHMPAFGAELRRAWTGRPPDVVHAHFWMSGVAATTAADECGVPVLQTFHALGVVKRRWQGAADSSPGERIAIERDLAVRVDRIIATCSDEVAELTALSAECAPTDVVPCGVDLATFAARPHPPRHEGPSRLIAVGRLVPRKGLADAIRAVALLPNTELLIVGGPARAELGKDPEARRLTALSKECGVADRVQLLGSVPHRDLPGLLRSATAVLAVPWYEPFGIVPVEAMACGVPVIATSVGGMLDTIVDGGTGLLVPTAEPEAIAVAVRRLVADPDLAAELGSNGARRAAAHYGWDRVAELTEASYSAALSQRARVSTVAEAV